MIKLLENSIKNKLMLGFLFLVGLTSSASVIAGYRIIYTGIVTQAYESVRGNLRTAKYIYQNRLNRIETALNYSIGHDNMARAVVSGDRHYLMKRFSDLRSQAGVDIIIVTDSAGRVVQRMNNSMLNGDPAYDIQCIRQAAESRKPVSGSGVLSRDVLLREGNGIAESALVDIIPTEMGRHITKQREDRALVLNSASPLFYNGKFAGIIYAAMIINNNYEIVDTVKNLVFHSDRVTDYETGKATIFLDDIRVSTNIVRGDGTRSTGTQVSSKVYESIFGRGEDWVDRAFVVSRWFLAAYTPIYDTGNSKIGILYVGVPQDSLDRIRNSTIQYYLFVTIITAIFAIMLSIYITHKLVEPINEVVAASEVIAGGDYSRTIRRFRENELRVMSSAFNRMIDAIYERDRKIKETTQNQLVRSEKLASLGRLAAGIAHEINNPLTGVLTYSSMLKDELAGTDYVDDIEVIIGETMRCRKTLKEVLDFARETGLSREYHDIHTIINSVTAILERHVKLRKIKIKKNFSENLPRIPVDLDQMKSVVNNLSLNAADAMPDGGELVITTTFSGEENSVIISFKDTGTGIAEENLGKIFDPFFTTKEIGQGTGLGLAVIYGIIERHGGSISVNSIYGEGSEFIVKLPAGQNEPSDCGNS